MVYIIVEREYKMEYKMENKDEAYINKENTLAIKGIALILMFIHHFFTFPNWIISGASFPHI